MSGYRWKQLPFSLAGFRRLQPKPDFIIAATEFSRQYPAHTGLGQFFRNFDRAGERYKIAFRRRTPLPPLPLSLGEVTDQINIINPEVLIYKKARPGDSP
jgi:hypothetical protein